MLKIFIDNNPIALKTIWYHAQKNPNPGGHEYLIHIDISEQKLILLFERMLSAKIYEKQFSDKAKETGKNNSFNIVRSALDHFDEIEKVQIAPDNEIKWVLNSIEDVIINDSQMIIKGIASQAW